ncbi:MAG: 3-hydroxyacyl-CoA dehydrogenase/enoyl-CoA hydratase family protein [Myxococcota bacterium]
MARPQIVPAETLIGVVGAGNMGSGIAQKYASEGFPVIVVDVTEQGASLGRERIQKTLAEGVARGVFKQEQADAILARMTFTADKTKLAPAALVVEAVFEDKQVKQDLFRELDKLCGPETILGTNTSSFFVDDVAEATAHPERVVGLHYFYHPAKNRLVEVIRGKATSDESFARAWAIQELSAKTPIESKDAPGFIVNRFFVPWLNESMRLVEEGVANIATVEAAAKEAFGVGMGPFELMNVTGVPITLHAATTLGAELGHFYAPCDLIRPIVERREQWSLEGDVDQAQLGAVADRLWAVVAQIACRIVFDEKVCTLEDCDLGARVGLRWPRGPFEAMNGLGTQRVLTLVEQLAQRYQGVTVPEALIRHGKEYQPFDLRFVRGRKEGGIGYVTFERPDAMNALNEIVVEQLGQTFDALASDPEVKGIVLEGKGKAFVAGADTRFFVDQINASDVPRIVRFAALGQEVFRRIDLCPKPVVCALDGLSLGGGSELALACDFIVATPRGALGFPETGIGIYPGLGGTQRSARRVGVPLARWLVLAGDIVDAKAAHALGLVDEVVSPSALDETLRRFALGGETRPEQSPPTTVPPGYEAVARLFASPLTDLVAGAGPTDDEKLAKLIKKLSFKAPLALRAADELLLAAQTNTLEAGLHAETAGLDAIFRTEDALTGLSLAGRGRPTFTGR